MFIRIVLAHVPQLTFFVARIEWEKIVGIVHVGDRHNEKDDYYYYYSASK